MRDINVSLCVNAASSSPRKMLAKLDTCVRMIVTALALLLMAGPVWAGTNRVFVSNERGNALTVLNASDYSQIGLVRTGARPRGMLFSPDRKLLYVACGGANRIDAVDVAMMRVVSHIGSIDDPETFDIDREG